MADYREWNMPEYKGNPLIEALPEYLGLKDFMLKIISKPEFSPEERVHNELERDIYTERLDDCVIPLADYYIAYKKIYKLLLKSYIHRNPLDPKTQQIKYSIASNGKIPYPKKRKKTTADSIFITGLSGMGKSWLIGKIFETIFKQTITHDKYHEHNLNFKQLVYVIFNCPGDASRSTLLLNFFKAVDESTENTNYAKENSAKKLQLSDLENNMQKVCLNHYIGVVIIDELQNLSIAKSGGAKSVMRFFENIANDALVSLVFIGTYDCFDIYDGEFSIARRMAKNGMIDLEQPKINDESWLKLLKILWGVQWVKNPMQIFKKTDQEDESFDKTLAQNVIDAIYFCTQGITVCTIALMKHANVYAIEQGLETINVDIIYEVYKNEFKLLHPALEALETGHWEDYDELMPIAERIKGMRKKPEEKTLTTKNPDDSSIPDQEESEIVISPNKLQNKKRKKESAEDCFNRLKLNNFFCKSMEELFG